MRANTGITSLRWSSTIAALGFQGAFVTVGACPLVLAHTACTVMVGHSILTFDATLVAEFTNPVAMTFASSAVVLAFTMVALVLDPALVTGRSCPKCLAPALRA